VPTAAVEVAPHFIATADAVPLSTLRRGDPSVQACGSGRRLSFRVPLAIRPMQWQIGTAADIGGCGCSAPSPRSS
jgi:hypothetical protein